MEYRSHTDNFNRTVCVIQRWCTLDSIYCHPRLSKQKKWKDGDLFCEYLLL